MTYIITGTYREFINLLVDLKGNILDYCRLYKYEQVWGLDIDKVYVYGTYYEYPESYKIINYLVAHDVSIERIM